MKPGLRIASPLLVTLFLSQASQAQTWVGNGGGAWTQPDSDADWSAPYNIGAAVVFDDTAAGTRTVTVDGGGVTPGNLTVTTTSGYTLTGGGIGGSGALTKNGTGTLRLEGANTFMNGSGRSFYSGGSQNAGTLALASAQALSRGSFQIGYGSSITWSNISAGELTITNNILNGGGSQTLTLAGGNFDLAGGLQFNNGQGNVYALAGVTGRLSGAISCTGVKLYGPGTIEVTATNNGSITQLSNAARVGMGVPFGAETTILNGQSGVWLYGLNGPRTFTNALTLSGYGGNYFYFIGTNALTFTGPVADGSGGSNRGYDLNVAGGLAVSFYGAIPGAVGSSQNYYTKSGAGLLVFGGTNTYTFRTYASGGALRAQDGVGLPTNSFLFLSGGVLETSGTFNRTLAAAPAGGVTGGNQFRWHTSGGGGFAAFSGPLTVDVNGGGADNLTWNSGNFVPNGLALILGSASADNVVTFVDNINLNVAVRTVQVDDNPASSADAAVLSGSLSGTGASGLTKTGSGSLRLNGANTYTNLTTVSAGGLGGSGSLAGGLTIASGASFDAAAGNTLTVTRDVTLQNGCILNAAGINETTVLFTYGGTLSGTFTVANKPPAAVLSYGSGANSRVSLLFPAGVLLLMR